MATWLDIADGVIDRDSPLTETITFGYRDNILVVNQPVDGMPVPWNSWHPYNMIEVGDGNDGTIYDQSVDGKVSFVTVTDLPENHEFQIICLDISHDDGITDRAVEIRLRNPSGGVGNWTTITGSIPDNELLTVVFDLPTAPLATDPHIVGSSKEVDQSGNNRIAGFSIGFVASDIDAGKILLYKRFKPV